MERVDCTKKLVYIFTYQLPADSRESKANGVVNKIWNQYEIFQKSYDTYLLGYAENGIGLFHEGKITIMPNSFPRAPRRWNLFAAGKKIAQELGASCFYIRYGFSDGVFITMLRAIKNSGASTVLEIPTFPYKRTFYRDRLLHRLIMRPLDCHYRKKLFHYVDRIATFSEDRKIFGIPCIHIVNGISVNSTPVRKPVPHKDAIHLIGVASMRSSHGYDRMISGLSEYYRNGGERKIVFHVVGDGPELPKYKDMVEKYSLQSHVIFHGPQFGEALDELFNSSDVAVECLGCHRNNIFIESSLKSREYVARGIPIISSCKIDVVPNDFPYLLSVPADESPVNISDVIRFFDKIYGLEPAETVIEKLRAFASLHCDMITTMKPIIESFTQILEQK